MQVSPFISSMSKHKKGGPRGKISYPIWYVPEEGSRSGLMISTHEYCRGGGG